jgi:signal transduction histidine kinase
MNQNHDCREYFLDELRIYTRYITHKLNNLISVVSGSPELLSVRLPVSSPAQKILQNIYLASRQMSTLVRNLTLLASRCKSDMDQLDCNALIELTLPTLDIPDNVQIKPGFAIDPVTIYGDESQLICLLNNAITCAIQISGDSHTITLSSQYVYLGQDADGKREVSAGEYARIGITGENLRFPEEYDGFLQEPFETIQNKLDSDLIGLSLSVLASIMKDYHGFAGIERNGDNGLFLFFPAPKHDLPDAGVSE